MNAIELTNVTKVYRKYARRKQFATLKSALLKGSLIQDLQPEETFPALQGVSFSVPAGRTYAVIGRNGSGKSTALKLVAGITKPTTGTVKVKGRISALIELGAGFHPEISGRENVFINGIMLGLSKRDIGRRFDEIVEFAEMQDFIDAPVKTYSSGMYMRLGFAVAIHVDPEVLLVDEVLAVGDAGFTHKCLDKFAEFRRRGRTVLIVTHSLDMVTRFCDEALWLDAGRPRAQGDPQRVIDAYLGEVARSEQQSHPAVAPSVTREVAIVSTKLLGSDGLQASAIASGDRVCIETTLRALRPVSDVVISFAIFNGDGVRCCAMHTGGGDLPAIELDGEGTVNCVVDRLDLVAGTYTLDLTAHRQDGTLYDESHRCTFNVTSRTRDSGIFNPSHTWAFAGGFKTAGAATPSEPRPVS